MKKIRAMWKFLWILCCGTDVVWTFAFPKVGSMKNHILDLTFDLRPVIVFSFFSQSCHFWNEEHVSGEGKWIYVRDNVFPLTSSMLYIVMSQNKKAKPYRNSFVDCIVLEIYETVYGQTSRFVAAGLLVTISKKLPLYPYSKIQLNPTRNPNSKIQLEILIRKLVCLVSSRSHVNDCKNYKFAPARVRLGLM